MTFYREQLRDRWLRYLGQRTGTMEYRFLRYAAVADELERMGLDQSSLLVDVGAGSCDLDFYLRTVRGFRGRYLPVDGAIDGTELDLWEPPCSMDYVAAIEVLEHLRDPHDFVKRLLPRAHRIVATTPNTGMLGVQAVRDMDETHISPLFHQDLLDMGATWVRACSFFGKTNDTLLAVWEPRQ